MEEINKEKEGEKFDRETVENDFRTFCREWRIDTDTEGMDDKERDGFVNLKRTITKEMRRGCLVYNQENQNFILDTIGGDKIHFNRPKGRHFLKMDDYKENQSVHKLYRLIEEIIGKERGFMAKQDYIDISILTGLMNLFLSR